MTTLDAMQSLSKRMGGGAGLLTAWVGMPDPMVAGMLAREDFDAVTLDVQHGANDIASITNGIAQVALHRHGGAGGQAAWFGPSGRDRYAGR